MKRKGWLGLGLAVGVLAALPAVAAEVGDFAGNGFKLGVEAEDETRQVNLKGNSTIFKNNPDTDGQLNELKWKSLNGKEENDRLYVKPSFGFADMVEVYLKAGVSQRRINFSNTKSDFSNNGALGTTEGEQTETNFESDENTGFFGGAGIKVALYNQNNLKVGVDAQYNYQHGNGFNVFKNDTLIDQPGVAGTEKEEEKITDVKTNEVQLALQADKKMGDFTPYGGVKVSWYQTEYRGKYTHDFNYSKGVTNPTGHYSHDIKFVTQARDYVGLFVGASYNLTTNFVANAEVGLFDETGFSVGLGYKF